MTYSDVVNKGLVQPKKEKYTMRDVHKVSKELNVSESHARFICVCSAIYHDTDYSKYLGSYHSQDNKVKRMVGLK